ncbi:hypothetical protein [Streptomyces sp. LN704]|uniref:phosphotriesterase family protein n=1 Tax=unclassified Streptomyces TaxID=2593676 RepID=UPI003714F706
MTSPSQVQTVGGPVPLDGLGTVLMHEHVFVLSEEFRQSLPETWDERERVSDAVRRLKDLVATGVTTIVDPTVIGLGRDVGRVALVNEQVDLNIIAATGIYTLGDVPNFFRYHGPGTMLGGTEGMTELFVRELTEGIADTGIRAAFLKCAIEEELTPGVERVMRAVAQAHLRTGAPITVHTSAAARTGRRARSTQPSAGRRRRPRARALEPLERTRRSGRPQSLTRTISRPLPTLPVPVPAGCRCRSQDGRKFGTRISPGALCFPVQNFGARDHRTELPRKGRGNSENGVTSVVTPPSPF